MADPVVNDASYVAVHGTNGYSTTVHPAGYGPIALGEQYLNEDWTLAMSVKSCDVENGILLALGGNGMASIGRELRILSSSTPGKLSAVIAQTWNVNYNQNTPASIALTDLGDTTGSFHTLVAVHTKEGGVKKITLPRKVAKVTEAFSGRLVAENVQSFEYEFAAPETALFELEF